MRPDELESRLRAGAKTPSARCRAELIHILMLPDFDRADAIGSYSGGTPRPEPSRNS